MDNSTAIRRKAQKLIQKGAYDEAVSVYAKLAESSHLEPYDLVVYADLLSRNGNRPEAVSRYLEAMDSYSQAGLFRNAIALGKKLQRLSPDTSLTHRKLGDLYASEGLGSEACLHYLEFLQQTPGTDNEAGNSILEVATRLLELSLPSFDLVDRIVDAATTVGRGKELAGGVLSQAERAATLGNADARSHLVELARKLDPEAAAPAPAGSGGDRMLVEPGTVDLRDITTEPEAPLEAVEPIGEPAPAPEVPSVLSLDGFDFEEAPAASPDAGETAGANGLGSLNEVAVEPEPEPELPAAPEREAGTPEVGDSFLAGTPEPPREAANLVREADAIRTRAMTFLGTNDPVRAQMEFMKAAGLYFEAARSRDAAELYERVVSMDPNHLDALRGLVEIAHINGEKGKMAHWGCELGDVLLAREKYPEAKMQFERVLAFDPKNAKAQARVKRLNTMAGVKEAGYSGLAPATSEVQGAQVTVRDDEAGRGNEQSALNLSQILDEFRAAVVDSIPAGDARSHFDLGMTYMEMGLHAEAAVEFETSSGDENNRLASLEMLGECYLQLGRFQDAFRAYELLVDEADGTVKARACYHLAQAAEALGEWDRAEAEYTRALDLDENFEEALERLQDLELRREQGAA